MRNYTIGGLFIYFLLGCNHNHLVERRIDIFEDSIVLSPNFSSIRIDSSFQAAIDSFVTHVHCTTCIFEMHINKILPDSILVSLMAKGHPTKYLKTPLFKYNFKNITFYIYTGLEDIFLGKSTFDSRLINLNNNKEWTWTISMNKSGCTIDTNGSYSFFPSSRARVYFVK